MLSHTGGTGGASLLVDGFYAASLLRELAPDAYDVLSRVRVPAHAAGEAQELYRPWPTTGFPVLGHGARGELCQVRSLRSRRCVRPQY
jgi:trimethyllysine dioxygenase